ncbi:MAG: deoxyribodipyrimidine photo-lyase, partial [Pseudomonadota bacterium]
MAKNHWTAKGFCSNSVRMSGVHVIWFKRDLRVQDHAALNAACLMAARDGGKVLPLYVIEPDYWALPEHSGRQFAFVYESLVDLDEALVNRGSRLCVRIGDVVDVLQALHMSHGLASVHAHEETGLQWTYDRDRAVAGWCRRAGVPLREQTQTGVIRVLKTREGWARHWHKRMDMARLSPPERIEAHGVCGDVALSMSSNPPDPENPVWQDLAAQIKLDDDPCPGRQAGGRRAGLGLLKTFTQHRGAPYRRAMSSPLTAFEACSRLSPHLAFGTVSVREAYQAARKARDHHDL